MGAAPDMPEGAAKQLCSAPAMGSPQSGESPKKRITVSPLVGPSADPPSSPSARGRVSCPGTMSSGANASAVPDSRISELDLHTATGTANGMPSSSTASALEDHAAQ